MYIVPNEEIMRHIISFEHNKKHLISFNGERPALKIQGKVQTYSNHWKGYIINVKADEEFTAPRDGYFLSNEYFKKVLKAKVKEF